VLPSPTCGGGGPCRTEVTLRQGPLVQIGSSNWKTDVGRPKGSSRLRLARPCSRYHQDSRPLFCDRNHIAQGGVALPMSIEGPSGSCPNTEAPHETYDAPLMVSPAGLCADHQPIGRASPNLRPFSARTSYHPPDGNRPPLCGPVRHACGILRVWSPYHCTSNDTYPHSKRLRFVLSG